MLPLEFTVILGERQTFLSARSGDDHLAVLRDTDGDDAPCTVGEFRGETDRLRLPSDIFQSFTVQLQIFVIGRILIVLPLNRNGDQTDRRTKTHGKQLLHCSISFRDNDIAARAERGN